MILSLLFIIFGEKIRDKDFGPSYPANCPHCSNRVYFRAYKWRSWYHVYWIPLIPTRANRTLLCPICEITIDLEKDEFKNAKGLVEDTEQYQEKQISEREYEHAVLDFENNSSFTD